MTHGLMFASFLLLAVAAPVDAAVKSADGSGLTIEVGPPVWKRGGETRHPLAVDRRQIERAVAAGRPLMLPSTGAAPLVGTNVRVRDRDDGIVVVTATVSTSLGPQSAVLTLGDGVTFGYLPQRDGAALSIDTKAGRTWLVENANVAEPRGVDFLRVPPATASQREARRRQDMAKSHGSSNVDVVVLYTPTLVNVWGSDAAMKARIAHLEAITNQAYVDSDVDQTVTVVGAYMVDYINTLDNIDALESMSSPGASALPRDAHRLREIHGADLVSLLREFDRANQTSCGVGWLGGYDGSPFTPDWGFSVSADHGFGDDHCGEWTFAHELGHNMGAHHDIETSEGEHGAYPYSRGFRRTLSPTAGFATVMGYTQAPQVRLGRFSSPRIATCLDELCGDAATADNARGLNEAAHSIAAFGTRPADSLPGVSIGDVVVKEGNGGPTTARFLLKLSAPATTAVTIDVETMNGTALMADFVAASGPVTILAGQSSAIFDVTVRGDTLVERDEFFAVNLVKATGARIDDAQGIVTIENDEPIPSFSLADAEVTEGAAGTSDLTFTATLSAPSSSAVTFDVDISEFSVDGARVGEDYDAVWWDDLVIPAGTTSLQFTVKVIGDTLPEPDERLRLVASGLTGAQITRDWAVGWIRNDDGTQAGPIPQANLWGPLAIVEGNTGTRTLEATVNLSTPTTHEVRFDVAASGSATAGVDYTLPSPTVVVPPGASEGTIFVSILGDTLDESDETLTLTLSNPVGATLGNTQAAVTIHDDDGTLPPLVTRTDRIVSTMNSEAFVKPLANDAFQPARMRAMTLEVLGLSAGGTATVGDNGFPGALPEYVYYTPAVDFLGEESIAYRLCESEPPQRCADGRIDVVVRPSSDIRVESEGHSGFSDLFAYRVLERAESRYAGEFAATPLVAPRVSTHELGVDPTPESPWDGARDGTATRVGVLPLATGVPVDWRVLVDATPDWDDQVDVYVGLDTDLGQDADPGEITCASSRHWDIESRCELSAVQPGSGVVRYWIVVHNRGASPTPVRLDAYEVPLIDTDGSLVVTGPGTPDAGAHYMPYRGAWSDPTLLPADRRAGYVAVKMGPALSPAWIPMRITRTGGESAIALRAGEPTTLALAAGTAHERMFVDVPVGATRMTVTTASEGAIDLYLAHATPAGAEAGIAAAPARELADASATGAGGGETIIRSGTAELPPGRWYVTPVNTGSEAAVVDVAVDIDAVAAPVRPGSYFNAARAGHGLFLYPAGGDWAGLWYTYLQDGTPTWYYLQGTAPGADGIWTGGLYRAMWDGDSHSQVAIGRATVTPGGADAFTFTYSLDGETGSEPLAALGRGCPMLGDQPVDASAHWFNPATAGTGHSVQLWSHYEFYAAFVYDADGRPRFLTAETTPFAGADASLTLEQLFGFCPLCDYPGAPARTPVGTLRRVFTGGTLSALDVAATFADGVPGAWEQQDPVQPLGGPDSTQGCAP